MIPTFSRLTCGKLSNWCDLAKGHGQRKRLVVHMSDWGSPPLSNTIGSASANPRTHFVRRGPGGNPVLGNTGGLYFNPASFTMAPVGTFGNSGRDNLRGPGFNDTDMAVIKDTKIREGMNLQFRAEFFNLFNHANYGVPIAANGTANLYTGFTTAATANGLPTVAIAGSNAHGNSQGEV